MAEYQYPETAYGLVNATHSGKLDQVKRIIESGVDPDDYTGNSMPALTCSCANGDLELVKYLLDQGANPNNYTEGRLSALKSAAKANSLDIVKLLLKANAEPNYEKDGNVALTLACDSSNDKELVAILLDVTDEKYYQKAYEYSQTEEIRNLIKTKAPHIQFVDPIDGFGGPDYKIRMHYDTPPSDPILRQICELLDEYIDEKGKVDPNRTMMYIFEKMSIIDTGKQNYDENGKLQLSKSVRDAVKSVIELKKVEGSNNEYVELYQLLNNYASDSDSDSDSNE